MVSADEVATVFKEADDFNAQVNPDNEPFKFKYKARELLVALLQKCKDALVESKSNGEGDEATSLLTILTGRVQHKLGLNYMECEELTIGSELLGEAVDKLGKGDNTDFIGEICSALNNIGLVKSQRDLPKEAYGRLRESFNMYKKATKLKASGALELDEEKWSSIEDAHTHCLYYLAQVYGQLQKADESAKFCQMTLVRQVTHKTFVKRDWITNAIGLAIYFSSNRRFQQAHHCLTAAQSMLEPGVLPLKALEGEDGKDEDEDRDRRQIADLCRAWGSFHLHWLRISEQRYLERQAAQECKEDRKQYPLVLFEGLQLPEPPKCVYATSYEEARDIFKKGFSWFQQALKHYVLDGYVSDHIHICQDISQLYKHLSSFEANFDRCGKMQRRRIHLLEPLIKDLSTKYYLEFYQQLTDEVARCYSDIMELKVLTLGEGPWDEKKVQTQSKINQLAARAVQYHDLWMLSFDKKLAQVPTSLDPAYHQPFLATVFARARLYGKIFTPNAEMLVDYLRKSLECYQQVLTLHTQYEVSNELMPQERKICEEMVQLLPTKINRIHASGNVFQLQV